MVVLQKRCSFAVSVSLFDWHNCTGQSCAAYTYPNMSHWFTFLPSKEFRWPSSCFMMCMLIAQLIWGCFVSSFWMQCLFKFTHISHGIVCSKSGYGFNSKFWYALPFEYQIFPLICRTRYYSWLAKWSKFSRPPLTDTKITVYHGITLLNWMGVWAPLFSTVPPVCFYGGILSGLFHPEEKQKFDLFLGSF